MNKKNILIIVVTLVVLSALSFGAFKLFTYDKKTPDGFTDYTKTKIDIDASLATQPLADVFTDNLTNFNITHDYTNTDPAYTKLINKETDLILVTYPSDDELALAKSKGVDLEITPVVNEGFVFFTSKKNKVDDLKLTDVQNIYTGKTTNWKDLGGSNSEIIAYQRPLNSGSQTGMLNMVMKGLTMKAPTTKEYVETMVGIIDVISNYEDGENAIGYSYYYYATTMYGNDTIKFFKIDGVEPNYDTIQDESYPLLTSYYMVTRKGETNSTLDALKTELLSSRGQIIAKDAGYVALKNK